MAVAKGISIYGNGVNLGAAFTEFSPSAEVEPLDATTLNDTSRIWELGFKNGTVSANGVWKYDTTNADEIHDVLSAAYSNGSAIILTASFGVLTVGLPAVLLDGRITKFAIPTQVGQLIMVSSDFQAIEGVNFGVWLFNEAVDNETATGTTVDNGAATTNGGVIHYHAQNVDLPDLTGATIDLEHSVDGSAWEVLVNNLMSDGLAENEAMSYTVPAGTTVRRYLRVVATTTGGIANIEAAFARR